MITSAGRTGRRRDNGSFAPMWIFLLEAGTALALFLFILWWTLPRKEKDSDHSEPPKALTDDKDDHGQP